MKTATRGMAELARLYGVETGFVGMDGVKSRADDEALRMTLRALGAPVDADGGLRHALQARRAELGELAIQPVTVAWNGVLPQVKVRLAHADAANAHVEIRLENGDVITHACVATPLRTRRKSGWQPTHALRMPQRLLHGYHTLSVETAGGTYETRIIAAPRHAHFDAGPRTWGLFFPLYALRGRNDSGVGNYSDLDQAARWVGSLGGGFVSTLPLLATFLDAPFDPSPYSPVSRLFWNELFLDVVRVPGFTGAVTESDDELEGDLVDYRRAAAAKRRTIERALRNAGDRVRAEMRLHEAANPQLTDYARFRAVCDRRRESWHVWPDRLRAGDINDGDYAREDYDYHVFAQWQCDGQLGAVGNAREHGAAALYLDMPLGVHPDGFDAWRFRDIFASGVSAGAPPDSLFTGGQDWGFRPLNPNALRASGYAYLIASLRHHFRHARMLRLDHVMSLYRLYWVPHGLGAKRGVYVRYPEDELFAVLVLESARHRATVIGEDLGTVPAAVRQAMDRHHVHRMHVMQFEASPDTRPVCSEPGESVVASLNTHDMPTFAGFWRGTDIDDQLDLALIDADQHLAAMQRRARLRHAISHELGGGGEIDAGVARQRSTERLSASAARYVLINLEDLWLEQQPQNVPGTSFERPNWRRRVPRPLDELVVDGRIERMLRSIGDRRRTYNDGVGTQ